MSERIVALRDAAHGRQFARGESGSLTIFSLFVILCMLMIGGLAVDFMRQESTRARLQSTLDRAILAAADMDQTLDTASRPKKSANSSNCCWASTASARVWPFPPFPP
jgi:Flp pilus assembly protein TadG